MLTESLKKIVQMMMLPYLTTPPKMCFQCNLEQPNSISKNHLLCLFVWDLVGVRHCIDLPLFTKGRSLFLLDFPSLEEKVHKIAVLIQCTGQPSNPVSAHLRWWSRASGCTDISAQPASAGTLCVSSSGNKRTIQILQRGQRLSESHVPKSIMMCGNSPINSSSLRGSL